MGQARLNRTRATEIAEDIIKTIETNRLVSGTKLPVQSVLLKRYKASSRTMSEAMDILKARNVIRTQVGKGAYVK